MIFYLVFSDLILRLPNENENGKNCSKRGCVPNPEPVAGRLFFHQVWVADSKACSIRVTSGGSGLVTRSDRRRKLQSEVYENRR